MVPTQQFTGQGSSSPAAPHVLPVPPGIIPVMWPTPSSSTLYSQLPGASGTPPISLQTRQICPPADARKKDVVGIADFPPLQEIS